jgi:hypothetical protein
MQVRYKPYSKKNLLFLVTICLPAEQCCEDSRLEAFCWDVDIDVIMDISAAAELT